MSVLVNFSMFPTDKGSSVSTYVSRILKMLKESGAKYRLTAMATIVETENMEEAMSIIQKAYKLLEPDCERVYSAITLDIQTNKPLGRIDGKIQSIENKIGKVHS